MHVLAWFTVVARLTTFSPRCHCTHEMDKVSQVDYTGVCVFVCLFSVGEREREGGGERMRK